MGTYAYLMPSSDIVDPMIGLGQLIGWKDKLIKSHSSLRSVTVNIYSHQTSIGSSSPMYQIGNVVMFAVLAYLNDGESDQIA